jgi:hypothetical protein
MCDVVFALGEEIINDFNDRTIRHCTSFFQKILSDNEVDCDDKGTAVLVTNDVDNRVCYNLYLPTPLSADSLFRSAQYLMDYCPYL